MKSSILAKILTVCFCIFIINLNTAFGCIWQNGAGGGYQGGGDGGDGLAGTDAINNMIEYYITLGAGYYLSAGSNFQSFLKMVEMQDIRGIDIFALQKAAGSSLVNMKNAAYIYMLLVKQAETTPYNEAVIAELKDFDYHSFMLENGLNPVVFAEVEGYLQKGDITGLLKKVYTDLVEIDAMLKAVNEELTLNRVPPLPGLWRLNETFSRVSLSGSYTARVFAAVL
jgi:hypothetical protein